jgi:hypothetical protein
MSVKILQLLPAPEGLVMLFKGNPPLMEPPACLALVQHGQKTMIQPIEVSDGQLLVASENEDYLGITWEKDLPSG